MRLVLRGALFLLICASCGNPEDASRAEPIAAAPQPGSTTGAYFPTHSLQLFLRFEKDQHELVKLAPGPCG
jgi:hypothetical protein